MRKLDPDRVIEDVGRRVAELRAELGMTQAEFAERLGIATNNVQRIEIGMQNLTLRTIVKLASALGARPIELLEAPRTRTVRKGRPRKRLPSV